MSKFNKEGFMELSVEEIHKILKEYSETHKIDINSLTDNLITEDIQNRLILLGVNSVCPECGSSHIRKNGTRGSVQRIVCKDCGKRFTPFTDTLMEKSSYSWNFWVKLVQLILLNTPIETMKDILISDFHLDGLTYKTVFRLKHKVLHCFQSLQMPKLSGVIQVDETSFREAQKGSRNLVSFVKDEERKPRYGRRPSKYGVMGNEFATVTCLVNLNNLAVAKVTGLGKMDLDTFCELFDEYIDNPVYICSDGNKAYRQYSRLKGIDLYVKPSNYVEVIQKAGYQTLAGLSPAAAKTQEAKNTKILRDLYNDHKIDYIYRKHAYSYKKFDAIKQQNSLSLARVNAFHKELKKYINKNMAGVSTEYLPDYVAFYVFRNNWTVMNGRQPSTLEDAEQILIQLLKTKVNYTISDMDNQEVDVPKVSGRYMQQLKEMTEQAKKITMNPYFKYDQEDGMACFDRRLFLEDLPGYKLQTLRRKYRLPKSWIKRSIINELLKKPDIDKDILTLIYEGKHSKISEEDRQAIEAELFKT